jgi:hypothetical protein
MSRHLDSPQIPLPKGWLRRVQSAGALPEEVSNAVPRNAVWLQRDDANLVHMNKLVAFDALPMPQHSSVHDLASTDLAHAYQLRHVSDALRCAPDNGAAERSGTEVAPRHLDSVIGWPIKKISFSDVQRTAPCCGRGEAQRAGRNEPLFVWSFGPSHVVVLELPDRSSRAGRDGAILIRGKRHAETAGRRRCGRDRFWANDLLIGGSRGFTR